MSLIFHPIFFPSSLAHCPNKQKMQFLMVLMEETYGPNFTFKTLSSLHPPHSSTHKGKAMCPDTWSYVHWNIVPLAMPNCTWYPNLRSRNTLLSLQQVNHSNSNWKTGICIIITLSVIQMQKRQCYVPGHLVLTPECIEMLLPFKYPKTQCRPLNNNHSNSYLKTGLCIIITL